MDETSVLHTAAMAIADDADELHRHGDTRASQAAYRRAFGLESRAAAVFLDLPDYEPTRSVLFRSAACLALSAGMLEEAARMAREGLRGRPPGGIRRELMDVLEEAEGRLVASQEGAGRGR